MLTPRHLATLRAALLYWQEEISPHEPAVAQPYLESADRTPLNTEEIAELRKKLEVGIRYAIYDPSRQRLDDLELFAELEEVQQVAGELPIATVLLPIA